ncbi:MAG TPA: DUF3500 domain-containing protein [Blastocatellia bacterium]|nr:DUF3500 domain-containing protein [Blastocatellia bacterium]
MKQTNDKRVGGRREFLQSALGVAGVSLLESRVFPMSHSQVHPPDHAHSAGMMSAAAGAFVNSLSPDQRARATFGFEDEQRFDWHFIPRPRKGIPFKDLDPVQRLLGNALLSSGLGQRGLIRVATIMSLDAILRELEQGSGPVRDPELYFLSLFGDSRSSKPWGWRLEGHHVALNFTLVEGKTISSTPAFLGANPAEVLQGARKGLRALAPEEDLARQLIKSLDDKQRAQAVVSEKAPSDILSTNLRKAEPLKPAGLAASKLGQKQQEILMTLLGEYASRHAPDIAAERSDRVRSAGLGSIFLAWAGGFEKGQPHYYRIQGPSFLVEYDNIQNNANHIHTVWRDFTSDFGADLLALHYKQDHR